MKRLCLILFIAISTLTFSKDSFEPVVLSLGDAVKSIEDNDYKIEKVIMGTMPKNHIEYYAMESGVDYGILTVCSPKVKDMSCLLHRNVRGGKWSKVKEEAFSSNTSTVKFKPYKSGKYRFEVRLKKKDREYNKEYFYLILYSKL
jgi:hypothetical protein